MIIVVGVLTVRPRGWSGSGLATMILLAVSCAVPLLSRYRPELPDRERTGLLLGGAVVNAGLVALSASGTGYLFPFFLAGNAGYWLRTERALLVAGSCSALCGGALLLHIGPGHLNVPWQVGALSGLGVLLGMANRSRQEALNSAHAATEAAERAAKAAERAAQAEAREAVLTERGRIARDVHDVLSHSLASINLQLEVADALLETGTTGNLEKARQATRRAQSLVRESLVESQRTVNALREDVLPLLATLQAMLGSFGHDDTVAVAGEVRPVPTRPTQALIRIAQEALTNAARHAAGSPVTISVTFEPHLVVLQVVNDPPARSGEQAEAGGSGMGLVGMRERAALLQGSLSAGPLTQGPHSGGWQVQAIIPA